jgi:hypothetical protein
MVTPIFYGDIQNGKMRLEDKEGMILWMNSLEGKKIQVTIEKRKRKRTSGKHDEKGNQNGYLHGVVLPICSKELGYTIEEMKEIFIQMFSPYKIVEFAGKKIEIKKRTSEMTTVEFNEFIELIFLKMAEIGIVIPSPQK